MKFKQIITPLLLLSLIACNNNKKAGLIDGASGDMEDYEKIDVNAIAQAKPEIMVIPSDMTLKKFGAIRSKTIDGERFHIRDYKTYLLSDENFKSIAAYIQNSFNEENYPLSDFEQTLKNIDNRNAMNIASDVAQDARTRLLSVATPDIVLELDYSISSDYTRSNRSNKNKEVRYLLNAVDAYTNKVVATIQGDDMTGENGVELITTHMGKSLPKFMGDVQKYFSDILTRGREITVRINLDADASQKLTDESVEGDTYADEIVDYIKTHTVKGAYKLQTNTVDQLTFTNVRIKLLQNDGTQYGVYDWTRDLQKYLKKNLGLSSENRSLGLGDVVLTIKGMK